MNSVGIIGGGITGLTAAFYLKKAGFEVTIYEKSSKVGGVIRSYREGEWLAEEGPHTLLETSPKITNMIHDLGIEGDRQYANDSSKKRFIVRNKRPIPLPSSPVSFLKTDLFSLSAKLRLLREPFIKPWDNHEEESLAHFVQRRLGSEFLDYAINPFVAGVYAGDPKQLSVKQAFQKLYELEQKYGSLIKGQIRGAKERKNSKEVSKQRARLFSFKEGLETIPRALHRELLDQIKCNAPVLKISRVNSSWQVKYSEGQQERTQSHDIVLYCGHVHSLPDLDIKFPDGQKPDSFEKVYYPPVSVMTLGFKREKVKHALDGFGMLIPQKESFHILGTLFTSTLFSHRAPDGYVTLASFIGGARNPSLAESGKDELIEVTLKDLSTSLGINNEPDFVHHVYWQHAIPQYQIGYQEVKNLMDQLEELNPGFFMAGNYRSGISVSDCIVGGSDIASRIARSSE